MGDKPKMFADLPGWVFEVSEESAGVFRVRGIDRDGRSVEVTGTDPEKLFAECRSQAKQMQIDSKPG